MAASAAPVQWVARIGDRLWQQPAPAFAQGHAVRGIAGKHRIRKVVVAFRGDKTVAAAPVGAELTLPLPDVGAINALQRLGAGVVVVIGHAGDIEPDPF